MNDMQSLMARLGSVTHFKDLSPDELRAIIAAGRVRDFPAGATIVGEGEPCSGMFVLLSGRVELCKLSPQGQESILAIIEPVIMFNEVAVLDGGPNLARAVAAADCVTWQIGCESFQILLHRFPQIGLGLLRVLARRNRFLVSQYEDISFKSVRARAAKLLLDLSASGQQPIDRRRHPSHQLAARISTVPEAFSRALNSFKQQGLVACTRTEILIRDPANLARLAEQGGS